MFDWLFEGRWQVYASLGILAFLLLYLWKQVPRRSYLIGTGVCLLLIGLYWLLDRLVVTTREEVIGTIQMMADSISQKNVGSAFDHFADSFRTPQRGTPKAELRAAMEQEVSANQITSVRVWGFEFPPPGPVDRSQPVKVTFMFKVKGPRVGAAEETAPLQCDAVFSWKSPHGWQLLSCRIMDPMQIEKEIHVPY